MVLKRGALIKVRAFGGKQIVRRFLAKQNGTVLICSDEEYQSARFERRKPTCVGFPLSDVINVETERSARKSNKVTKPKVKTFRTRSNYHA
jgi:hypothetical protein